MMLTNQTAIEKIRNLQREEGSKPCFRSGKIFCPYEESCCWAEICDFEMVKIRPLIKFNVVKDE